MESESDEPFIPGDIACEEHCYEPISSESFSENYQGEHLEVAALQQATEVLLKTSSRLLDPLKIHSTRDQR